MKGLQAVTAIGGVALVVVGAAMALTNPGQNTYEEYAAERLTGYLQQNVCPQAPRFLGNSLESQCRSLIDSHQTEIKQLISQGTRRDNFLIFSIYKTDLSVKRILPIFPDNVLPAYNFQTVGVFDNFYTYQAQKQ